MSSSCALPVTCGTASANRGGSEVAVAPAANLCSDGSTPAVTLASDEFTWTCGAQSCGVGRFDANLCTIRSSATCSVSGGCSNADLNSFYDDLRAQLTRVGFVNPGDMFTDVIGTLDTVRTAAGSPRNYGGGTSSQNFSFGNFNFRYTHRWDGAESPSPGTYRRNNYGIIRDSANACPANATATSCGLTIRRSDNSTFIGGVPRGGYWDKPASLTVVNHSGGMQVAGDRYACPAETSIACNIFDSVTQPRHETNEYASSTVVLPSTGEYELPIVYVANWLDRAPDANTHCLSKNAEVIRESNGSQLAMVTFPTQPKDTIMECTENSNALIQSGTLRWTGIAGETVRINLRSTIANGDAQNIDDQGWSSVGSRSGRCPAAATKTAVGTYYFFNAWNINPDSNCCMRANRDANNLITACIATNGTVSTSNGVYSAIGVSPEPFFLTRYSDGTCVKE